MADRNDNKLAKNDKNDPRINVQPTTIKGDKFTSESEPLSADNADDKILSVDFIRKHGDRRNERYEDNLDFSKQAEAVLRLQKILENKKQSGYI